MAVSPRSITVVLPHLVGAILGRSSSWKSTDGPGSFVLTTAIESMFRPLSREENAFRVSFIPSDRQRRTSSRLSSAERIAIVLPRGEKGHSWLSMMMRPPSKFH